MWLTVYPDTYLAFINVAYLVSLPRAQETEKQLPRAALACTVCYGSDVSRFTDKGKGAIFYLCICSIVLPPNGSCAGFDPQEVNRIVIDTSFFSILHIHVFFRRKSFIFYYSTHLFISHPPRTKHQTHDLVLSFSKTGGSKVLCRWYHTVESWF